MRPAVIVDIDGTLCDSEHMHLHSDDVVKNDWRWFDQLIKVAEPFPYIINLVRSLAVANEVILITARDASRRDLTEAWLEQHLGIDNYILYMRPTGLKVTTAEYKSHVYQTYIQQDFDVTLAMDDSPSCIELWNGLGIPTLQVTDGEQLKLKREKL
jgi:phosphoglycolate phosphatase-like HAD superfamily hydrolase